MGDRLLSRAGRGAATAALAAVVLGACTTAVSGTASPAAAPGPPSSSSAPAPTTQPPVGPDIVAPPPDGIGRQLEAHRLAGATALVQTSFPERTENCNPSGPWTDLNEVESAYFVPGTAAPTLERYGFVTAWGQCHLDAAANLSTIVLVVELSDPESAVLAAAELAAASQDTGLRPGQLPGTGATALVGTGPNADGVEIETVEAWLPSGRMVAYTFHEAVPGQGVAGAGRLMTDQAALLAAFTPTPQADVPALPEDPNGLRDLTLDPPGDPLLVTGPYDLESYIRLAIEPFRERDVLTANGFLGMYSKITIDGTTTYASNLYGFPSSAQTNVAYVAFADLETAAFNGTPFQVPSIPEAPCFVVDQSAEAGTPYFFQRCYVGFGSYLAGVDVAGLTNPGDVAAMDQLLVAQRDLIDG